MSYISELHKCKIKKGKTISYCTWLTLRIKVTNKIITAWNTVCKNTAKKWKYFYSHKRGDIFYPPYPCTNSYKGAGLGIRSFAHFLFALSIKITHFKEGL